MVLIIDFLQYIKTYYFFDIFCNSKYDISERRFIRYAHHNGLLALCSSMEGGDY
jgi:hypothetical protein